MVWIGFIAGCLASFNIGKVPVALPLMSIDLKLDLFNASALVSVFSLLSASAGLMLAILGLRVGGIRSVLIGLACCAVAGIAGALSQSYIFLLLTRVLEGFGWLLISVSMPGLLATISNEHDRPLVFGLWGAFVPVGMMAALLVAPFLLQHFDWRSLWISSGVACFVWMVVFHFGFKAQQPGRQTQAFTFFDLKGALAYPHVWSMAVCFFAYSGQFIVVTGFLPTLLYERFSTDIGSAAVLSAVVVSANAFGNVAAGVLRRQGIHFAMLLIVAQFIMGVAALLLYSGLLSMHASIIAAVIVCGVGGLIPGTLFGASAEFAQKPLHAFLTVGLLMQFAGLGQLVSPMLVGKTVEWLGQWHDVVWVNFGLMVVGIAVVLVLYRRLPQHESPP